MRIPLCRNWNSKMQEVHMTPMNLNLKWVINIKMNKDVSDGSTKGKWEWEWLLGIVIFYKIQWSHKDEPKESIRS